jgi:hypothetical protein
MQTQQRVEVRWELNALTGEDSLQKLAQRARRVDRGGRPHGALTYPVLR